MTTGAAPTTPRTIRSARRSPRVALVGADGAGKSTVSRMLEQATLPFPVRRIYMGINVEASSLMLPTTRLLLAAKRARGGRPDLVAAPARPSGAGPGRRAGAGAREVARLAVWVLEEWLRQAVATWHTARGRVVVFDRHFAVDYQHLGAAADRPARAHAWLLRHAYPRPDLVICLDAPGDVLYARKPEAPVEWLESRRRQYLALARTSPAFTVVDADRAPEAVLADVVTAIAQFREGGHG